MTKGASNLTQDVEKGGTLDTAQGTPWQCMGRKQALPEPGECNWPDCGCDPHATKVIESLLEQGWMGPQEAEKSRSQLVKCRDALGCAGYTLLDGAEEWKPPLGPLASPLLERIDSLRGALAMIFNSTELGAIPHRDYAHLAESVCKVAKAALDDEFVDDMHAAEVYDKLKHTDDVREGGK